MNNNSSLGSGSFGTIKKAKNFKYDRHTNNTLSNNESIFKIFNTKASMNARASGKNYLKKEYNKYNKLKLKSIDPEQKYLPRLSTSKLSDGTLVSPPLEDLDPLISAELLQKLLGQKLHLNSLKAREKK